MKAEELVPKLARTEVFYFVARFCMIAALPLIAWFGTRIVAQADDLQKNVVQQNVELRILGLKLDGNVGQLSDHELRLRQLERR